MCSTFLLIHFFIICLLNPGNESVLLVRLRLLQGILSYLMNRQNVALEKFNEVENHIQILRIDDENVKTLCNLGEFFHLKSEQKLRNCTLRRLPHIFDSHSNIDLCLHLSAQRHSKGE